MEAENENSKLESGSVSLVDGMHFIGEVDGYRIDTDATKDVGGTGAGPQPLSLLLLSMASCTAMDVISILRKKRQQVSGLNVEVRGRRVEEHPRVYDRIEVLYQVQGEEVDPKAVERAIKLSETRYCPVIAMIGKVAEVTNRYEIKAQA